MTAAGFVRRAIAAAPTTVMVRRSTRTRSGGGYAATTSTLGPYDVLITPRLVGGRTADATGVGEGGRIEMGWQLLAPAGADLRAEATITDEIDAPGIGRFRVLDVAPLRVRGTVTGTRAALEMIS